MSILNRTNDGFWGILLTLYQLVNEARIIKKEVLLERCAPAPIAKKDCENTLRKWCELGLFVKTEKNDIETITVFEDYQMGKNTSYKDIIKKIPKILRKIVLSEQNNDNFWDTKKAKSADFTRALCWVLAQDIYEVITTTTEIENLEDRQLKDAPILLFKNDTRWPAMAEWMVALGFAWQTKRQPQIEIDPTVAIRESLIDVFGDKKTLTVQNFLERLIHILPILDNGSYRLEVEKKMDLKGWIPPKPKYLSTALSRALKRLEAGSIISFEVKSDSQKNIVNLTRRLGRPWGEVTHVSFDNRN